MGPTREQEALYKFDRRLMCSTLRVGHRGIDLHGDEARLYVAPGEAPDMRATIKAALKVDPDCQRITIYSGAARELVYVRGEDWRWSARPAKTNDVEAR